MTKQEMKKIIIEEYRELRENLINYIGVRFKVNETWVIDNLMVKINFMMELLDKLGMSNERKEIDKEFKGIENSKRKDVI